ncbi:MAG: superoxide dismutase [Kiritimatiellia bacterium]|nr:superoxide dismutase [Kiritimatiellia bacterium]
MPHELPKLPYSVDALEPHIDARTMEIHHGKHHAAYVNNLNAALEKAPENIRALPLDALLRDLSAVPESIRTAVRNNGGGVFNHSLFWKFLSPKGGAPSPELNGAIEKTFGSLDGFKDVFSKAAATRFGSGWAWLTVKSNGELCVCSSPNQDNPIMKGISECTGEILLALDVWEHAYYLNYQNRRPDYIAAWWNVVNWEQVNALFAARKSQRG